MATPAFDVDDLGNLHPELRSLRGLRLLVVASTGGHLAQAVQWHQRLGAAPQSHFVTFASRQSESLLGQYPHSYVPYVAPRDVRGVVRALKRVDKLVGE